MKPTFNPVTKFHVSFFNTYLQDLRHFATLYGDRFFAMDSSEYELNKAALFKRRYGLDIIRKHRCQRIIISDPNANNSKKEGATAEQLQF